MPRRSITRYGPKGGVYHEHVNVSGGSSGGCGCMLFIGVAVLLVALLGGGIMLAVEHVKHLDQYGDPIGSHDPLTARSTCQNWTSGGPDVIKQDDFYTRYVTTDFDFYAVDWTGLTSYCTSHPTTLLTTAMLRTVVLPNGTHLNRSDIHT